MACVEKLEGKSGQGRFKPRRQNDRHGTPLRGIGVDAITDARDEEVSRLAHEPPESLSLRSQSTSSQIYWDGTSDLTMVFDSLPEPTQRAPENPQPAEGSAESLSTLKSFQSGVSASSTVVSRNASTISGDPTSVSVTKKRPAGDALSPFGEQTDGVGARNTRARLDCNPERRCESRKDATEKPNVERTVYNTPIFIAHSNHPVSGLFNSRGLSTGVQWELARLLTTKMEWAPNAYDDFDVLLLNELKGSNSEAAPKVLQLINPISTLKNDSRLSNVFAKESRDNSPWRELDEEERRLRSSKYGALGCDRSSMFDGKAYYGGKVHFAAKLEETNGHFSLFLKRAELGPSCRFFRRFGSSAFIKVSIPNRLRSEGDKLERFFVRPFVLNNRVFRAFYSKENSVHLKKTNERVVEGVIEPPENEGDLVDGQGSFIDFLNWYNPPSENLDKTMVKYTARMALGLSNSVPTVLVPAENIYDRPDIPSDTYDRNEKLQSDQDMTDGCGLINAYALRKIQEKLELDTFPTAVQVRFCGAKGLLCLDQHGRYKDTMQDPSVGLRPSQIKINHLKDSIRDDPTLRTIEVLRTSRMSSPARLSAEIIINLSENGVDSKVFKDLMRSGMDDIFAALTCWDSGLPDDISTTNLAANVTRLSGIVTARQASIATGESRARGFRDRDYGNKDDDNDDVEDEAIISSAAGRYSDLWADPNSGNPSSLGETALLLIASGFTPQACPYLAGKLEQILKNALKLCVFKYKMVVPMSCEALVIPDPMGVLNAGEVHIKRSRPMMGPRGFEIDIILGDVLVTRSPCKVPSDVQKVKAVQHDALSQYVDVIIFPVKGKRSLASMLGGGDYDGDRIHAIWQPEIVSKFKNADDKYASAPPEVLDAFEKNSESVEAFLKRSPPEDPANHLLERQKYLLAGLHGQYLVGSYSTLHDKSVYTLGYDHPQTIYAAYMFCNVLDGAKTGLKVKRGALMAELNNPKLAGGPPMWKEPEVDLSSGPKQDPIRRPKSKGVFIMDEILEEGKVIMKNHLKNFSSKVEGSTAMVDEILVKPWENVERWVTIKCKANDAAFEDLKKIKTHVEEMYRKHRKLSQSAASSNSAGSGTPSSRKDDYRNLAKMFAEGPKDLQFFDEGPGLHTLKDIMASYAYNYDCQQRKLTSFPWDVALGVLGEIKAKGLGPSVTITREMYLNQRPLS